MSSPSHPSIPADKETLCRLICDKLGIDPLSTHYNFVREFYDTDPKLCLGFYKYIISPQCQNKRQIDDKEYGPFLVFMTLYKRCLLHSQQAL